MPPPRFPPSPLPLLLRSRLPTPSLTPLTTTRPASHASQGRANKAAQGPGKRLGAKKGASELVVPGNIIFRQRGTHWFPGENCAMGRDHTIFAREKGYVVFYRDPELHAKRKYIGVVFERGEVLPRSRLRPRRRRLGLVGRERVGGEGEGEGEGVVGEEEGEGSVAVEEAGVDEVRETDVRQLAKSQQMKGMEVPKLELRPGYQYRESNWHIGRAAERADIKVREYKRGDRFLAWRKLNARKARNAERRALSSRKKKGNARRR